MTQDVRVRVRQFFAADKTLEGSWSWYLSERTNLYKFKREISEDGVNLGFKFEVNAYVDTTEKEFRYLITGLGACVCRLDCAPTTDGVHVNGPKRPLGFPFKIEGNHFHPWEENLSQSTASALSKKLPYALDSNEKMTTIQQGFWQFCGLAGIGATSADEPDWPKPGRLL